MSLALILVAVGFTTAFVSGLAGVGGAIVAIPLLIYLPPALGLSRLTIHEATGMSMVLVLVASVLGLWLHRRKGAFSMRIATPLILGMGLGATLGGLAAPWMPAFALQALFAALAAAGAVLMLMPARGDAGASDVTESYRPVAAAAVSGAVGIASGMVGVGGAFILTPLLRTVFGLPLRTIVGVSLAVVLSGAAMGTLGKTLVGQIPWSEALWLSLGAAAGAPLGALASHAVSVKALRWILAALILGAAAKLIWDLVVPAFR